MPVVLLPTLPCPDDITPITPDAETRSWRLSTTRIGLSAFVTMTRMNSSVVTCPIVSVALFVAQALTNSMSNRRPVGRWHRLAIWSRWRRIHALATA